MLPILLNANSASWTGSLEDVDSNGMSCLSVLVVMGNLPMIREVVERYGASVRVQPRVEPGKPRALSQTLRTLVGLPSKQAEPWEPLLAACMFGHVATVKYLLSKGAELSAVSAKDHMNCLSYAAANGHLEVVQELLRLGMDVVGSKDTGYPALEAAKNGYSGVFGALVQAGWQRAAQGTGNSVPVSQLKAAKAEAFRVSGQAGLESIELAMQPGL
jgi:hypothetical protein